MDILPRTKPAPSTSSRSDLLQRKCGCGKPQSISGKCGECESKKGNLQRRSNYQGEGKEAPPVIHEVLRSNSSQSQTKLKIGAPNDKYEQEADRIADQVMRMSEPSLHHQIELKEKEGRVQRSNLSSSLPSEPHQFASEVPPIVHEALNTPGRSLELPIRTFMESRFGYNFNPIRIHTDAKAAESTQSVDARAYTLGQDIAFAQGQYEPYTDSGKRLLAHELVHVLQQNTQTNSRSSIIRRKNGKKAKTPTAGDAPKLDLTVSKNGTPCACLVVIHNDERHARETAKLMHEHCSYNLLLMQPGSGDRRITLPRRKGDVDPNELFPPKIAEECMKDEQSCRDFIKNKSGTTNKADIEKFVQIQFFLAVSDCSEAFSLPVIALHNNAIDDTAQYLKKKDKVGVNDLKMDIDKTQKAGEEDPVKKMKDLIDKKFGTQKFKVKVGKKEKEVTIRQWMTETKGKTNIFRWCASDDLAKCHIGDPDHPDDVVWVTNEQDFQALSQKDINVALQSNLSSAKGSESETDFSTLFLVIEKLKGELLQKLILELEQQLEKNAEDKSWIEIAIKFLKASSLFATIGKTRFINIETPKGIVGKTPAEVRVENYEFIIKALDAVGLHCCGSDPTKAEKSIKEGLKSEKKK